jgi:hypothetical protein
MDLRDYTHTPYAGFFYTDSLEEGRKVYKIVRKKIHPSIEVILKRGCTEMEAKLSSDKWDVIPEEHLETERRLHDTFSFSEDHFYQSPWHKLEIQKNWLRHAIKIGDPTARETLEQETGDPDIWKKLVVESVTYHEEDDNNDT